MAAILNCVNYYYFNSSCFIEKKNYIYLKPFLVICSFLILYSHTLRMAVFNKITNIFCLIFKVYLVLGGDCRHLSCRGYPQTLVIYAYHSFRPPHLPWSTHQFLCPWGRTESSYISHTVAFKMDGDKLYSRCNYHLQRLPKWLLSSVHREHY